MSGDGVFTDAAKARSFDHDRLTFTEEQVKREASRCLGCGVSVVDQNKCIGCGSCEAACPQSCIVTAGVPHVIEQEHCLHCGNCMEACPAGAVERR